MIEVIRHGIYTSIQDMGRFNYESYGVPLSGALDQQSFRMANRILNNNPKAAAIEITIKGPKIRFHQKTFITLTGAKIEAKINGLKINNYIPIEVLEGDILEMGNTKNGCRTYLGVAGGIKTEKVMGSRSQFQGLTREYRICKKMLLPIGNSNFVPLKGARISLPLRDFSKKKIEVYPGPEFDQLTQVQKKNLLNSSFSLSNLNNRMAFRLKEKLKNELPQIWTAPVIPGTMQCTPEGSLIILMRDAQVTGGYPRILQLNNKGINFLSQKKTEDKLYFKLLSRIE